jgi:hypothetical protein
VELWGCSVPLRWVFCTPSLLGEFIVAKPKLDVKIPALSEADAHRLMRKVDEAIKDFQGDFGDLESAIGMYLLGRQVGWKVLVLIHNKRTIKKYEEIMKINIRKEFNETGPFTHKSIGYAIAQKINAFWKAVSGEVPLEHRRELQKG